ncbi:C-C motif chemokine 20a.3 [Paralichthys olivaceus]|uniref:C-C motif chemokine 20a.3 n=1 Tax=Paralichthys olivaceus TaxID=8255 RepID=UPI00097D478E|nr:PREDICTED: C-C motif chemokine 20-like [Paralichthys olivaceus]
MVSVKAAAMVITLLTVCLLATETSAMNYKCCLRYMKTKIPFQAIRGYSIQTRKEMCPIDAIIFHTKRGQTCADPSQRWVMDYVDHLRNKAQMVHNKNPGA